SWVLRSGNRGAGPKSPGGPFNGDYDQDYEYIDGKGDLDLCNGHFSPTPQYPNGIYHYHITLQFPYIPRCLRKKPEPDVGPPISPFPVPNKSDKPPIDKKRHGPEQGNH